MNMLHRVTAAGTILSVEKVGRAWIDARKAEAAAEKRLEKTRARRDAALRDLAALVERFPASVPGAYDKFRKATSSAIEDAERARREAGSGDVPAPFEPVDTSAVEAFEKAVAPYMNPLADIIGAEREVDAAFAALVECQKTTREAFNALRDLFGRASGDVSETMAAVDEIKKRSEQEKAAAREYLANCERLRGQMQGEG